MFFPITEYFFCANEKEQPKQIKSIVAIVKFFMNILSKTLIINIANDCNN